MQCRLGSTGCSNGIMRWQCQIGSCCCQHQPQSCMKQPSFYTPVQGVQPRCPSELKGPTLVAARVK
jgi:hypothetical protein